MKPAEIKLYLAGSQLKEIYGLVMNCLNGSTTEEWESLSGSQRKKIMQGLEEASAGLGTPAKEIIKKAREKYGLDDYKLF